MGGERAISYQRRFTPMITLHSILDILVPDMQRRIRHQHFLDTPWTCVEHFLACPKFYNIFLS